MRWEREKGRLKVELLGDFNYERVLKMRGLLKEDEELIVDLKNCRFVDTEAVDFLYNLKLKGRSYRLLNRPELLKKICKILGVEV